jgi:hypothetical protein
MVKDIMYCSVSFIMLLGDSDQNHLLSNAVIFIRLDEVWTAVL